MKFFVFGLVLLVAGASALPESRWGEGTQFAEGFKRVVAKLQKFLIDRNLDPFAVKSREGEAVREPLINAKYMIEGLEFRGISNIVIHKMEYSNLWSRLTYDLELPELDFAITNSTINGKVVTIDVDASLGGRLTISRIRLNGEGTFNHNILTGEVTIRDIKATFRVGKINSEIKLTFRGNDISTITNSIINDLIPNLLLRYEATLNSVIATLLRFIAELYLAIRVDRN